MLPAQADNSGPATLTPHGTAGCRYIQINVSRLLGVELIGFPGGLMFLDARKVDEGAVLQSAVCVIGAGVAGIAFALEFERHGIDCIVLESGGFDHDDATRDLNRGESIGLPYAFADGCRGRLLGGSSNCWGGWSTPLKSHEMERREWVPDSGWPFSRAELESYYERAHPILNLGPNNYDVRHWVSAIGRNDVRRIPLPTGRVEDRLAHFSSPSRMGAVYRNDLKRAKSVRVCLFANVVDIETDSSGQRVQRLKVKTLSGRSFGVEATRVVLAAGGIENARLLLCSNKVHSTGLGNAEDLVGRYFTDHPRMTLANVRLKPKWKRNKLYDIKFHYMNRAVSANGTYVAGHFAIDPKVEAQERLLSSQIWFSSVFPGEDTDAAEAVIRMKHRLTGKAEPDRSFWGDAWKIAKGPIDAGGFVAARVLQPEMLIKNVHLEVVCEPAPNRDSRVTLSSARDQLGMPRVCVDWRLGDLVKRTYDRTVEIFAEEMHQADVAEVKPFPKLEGREWPHVPATPWHHLGTWHHMGTTRMHDSAKHGVVDRDCKVHGLANLYIAGSSVFPAFGANMPTLTIAALSLRLADHLATQSSTA